MGNPAYIKDSAGNWIELGSPTTDLSNYANLTTTPISGFRNAIINGDFKIWQRGTSSTDTNGAGKFLADRWQIYSGSSGRTFSRQATGDLANLPFIQYSLRAQRDSGNTATQVIATGQSMETVNSIPFAGKTVTLSFYARAGANFSTSSSAITVRLLTGTGVDQNGLYSGYTGEVSAINTTQVLTTTWQRFTLTTTLNNNITEISTIFQYTPVGTAGANDWFEITGIQLERGTIATPFEQRPIGTELALCERYYSTGEGMGVHAVNADNSAAYGKFATTMRVAPSITLSNVTVFKNYGTPISAYVNTNSISNTGFTFVKPVVANGLPNPFQFTFTASAEL